MAGMAQGQQWDPEMAGCHQDPSLLLVFIITAEGSLLIMQNKMMTTLLPPIVAAKGSWLSFTTLTPIEISHCYGTPAVLGSCSRGQPAQHVD